jgi:hypothetical protein
LIKDAWRAEQWNDKVRVWFMPLGWRPIDVAEKYPVYKIEDVYHFKKYDPKATPSILAWSWAQMIMVLLFISYLFGNIANIGTPDMFIYGAFVFLCVYSYTELLDLNPYAYLWEMIKNAFGMYLLITTGDWFGLQSFIPGTQYFLMGYFILSTIVVWWFCQFNKISVADLRSS